MMTSPRFGLAGCIGAACLVVSTVAAAQTASAAPSGQAELIQATQAAKDAAQAAKDAAQAAQKAAEALAATLNKSGAPLAGTPEVPPPPPPPKPSAWNYQLALNLINDTGNATAFSGKFGGKVMGNWSDWLLTIAADTAYGQAQAFGEHTFTTTALNASGLVRGDRKFSDHFTAYLLGGAGTDHVASIQYLAYGEVGISVIWYQRKEADYNKVLVRTDVGFRYSHEVDYRYFATAAAPTVGYLDRPNGGNIYAPRIAAEFDYAISKTSLFTESAEVLEDVLTPKNVRFVSVTTISASVAKGFAVSLSFKVRYLGVPAVGALPTDTELAAGLTWTY